MEKTYAKIEPVILGLAERHKLEKGQISLMGVGGGAVSLIVYFSSKMGVRYSIPENAEVISSIGVVLSMVRDVVERITPFLSKDDTRTTKNEALNKAVELSATVEPVEIHIEIDPQTSKVTAITIGSTEVKTADLLKECDEIETRRLAAEDMRLADGDTVLLVTSPYFYVYGERTEPDTPGTTRIVDKKGLIKVQRGRAICLKTTTTVYLDALKPVSHTYPRAHET